MVGSSGGDEEGQLGRSRALWRAFEPFSTRPARLQARQDDLRPLLSLLDTHSHSSPLSECLMPSRYVDDENTTLLNLLSHPLAVLHRAASPRTFLHSSASPNLASLPPPSSRSHRAMDTYASLSPNSICPTSYANRVVFPALCNAAGYTDVDQYCNDGLADLCCGLCINVRSSSPPFSALSARRGLSLEALSHR